MKLLYVAVHNQNKGWGAESFLSQSFREIGVETYCLDFRERRGNLIQEIESLSDFDCLLLQRGDYFPISILKEINCPKFFWASELVSRNRDQDRLLETDLFEHIFLHTIGCKKILLKNNKTNKNSYSILLNGFDPKIHYPKAIEKDIDVLFIGNILSRRREILNKIAKTHSLVEAIGVYGDEMVDYINRAKIVLNIHSENFLDTETRVFEVLACKTFLLSEKLSEDSPFINGQHLVEVESVDDMISNISYYLGHNEEREQIAEMGYNEVVAKHTYKERAKVLATLFESFPKNNVKTIPDKFCLLAYAEQIFLYYKVYLFNKFLNLRSKISQCIRKQRRR